MAVNLRMTEGICGFKPHKPLVAFERVLFFATFLRQGKKVEEKLYVKEKLRVFKKSYEVTYARQKNFAKLFQK